MVRLGISVEGPTEERFVIKVMVAYLESLGVYATPLLLGSHGGDVSLPRVRKDLNRLANSFDVVSTLYDFYGFKGKKNGEDKESLERRIVECVSAPLREKIIPYVQMYEFEGLLFSSPEAIQNNLLKKGLKRWASDVLQQFDGDPEQINDSPQTAPSKRLLSKADYIKSVHGPNIAQEIGLDELREKCAGFNNWLKQLEALRVSEI